jgi:hypothetical protein
MKQIAPKELVFLPLTTELRSTPVVGLLLVLRYTASVAPDPEPARLQ